MKVVILAGGQGTRLAEETEIRPKPMVEIGWRPIIWHIMKHYAYYGFTEFVVALGYKGDEIKKFFADYLSLNGDITVVLGHNKIERHQVPDEDWTVHLVDTGFTSGTGGRVLRLSALLGQEPFMLTYGDGVSTVDLRRLLEFHRVSGKVATVTAVRPPSRFGGLTFGEGDAVHFTEKAQMGEGWINGGFMVLEPAILDRIAGDASSLETDVLEPLSLEGQLAGYTHDGFWQCMDTLRDVRYLRALWSDGTAPWAVWK